jgi:hypothetical protein
MKNKSYEKQYNNKFINYYYNMKVLSIDVGIKNLAFCLFEKPEDCDSFKITKWDIVNISEKETMSCGFVDKKGICNKPAKFRKEDQCFCLKHSKKQIFQVPTTELKPSYINKQKIQRLHDIADKYKIIHDKPIKKCELISLINDHVHNNCFQEIQSTNASKIDLISIGLNIKCKFDKLFNEEGSIDYVIIENQISPIANRMKTIQGMIAQYFIMSEVSVDKIEFVAASNKLKDCDAKDKVNYKDRKKLSIKRCLELITTNNYFNNKVEYFDKHSKKDDLADSFLQGMWFITDREI